MCINKQSGLPSSRHMSPQTEWPCFHYTHLLTTTMAFHPVYMFINKEYDLPSSIHIYQETYWPSFQCRHLSTNNVSFLPVCMFIHKQTLLRSPQHLYWNLCLLLITDLFVSEDMFLKHLGLTYFPVTICFSFLSPSSF